MKVLKILYTQNIYNFLFQRRLIRYDIILIQTIFRGAYVRAPSGGGPRPASRACHLAEGGTSHQGLDDTNLTSRQYKVRRRLIIITL